MDLVSCSLINTTTIGFLSLVIFLFLFLHYHLRPSNSKEPPLAGGAWPILGHLISVFSSTSQTPHRILGAMADRYGPLFTIKLGTTRALVLSNSEMAKECFTTNDMVVSSRPKVVAVEHMAYDGAMFGFAPYGPYWRHMRKITTLEILTNCRVEQLGHVRVSEIQTSFKELYKVWSSKNNNSGSGYVLVELKQWFTQMSFNMVLRMAVGKRYFGAAQVVGEQEAHRCTRALRDFMRLLAVFTVGDAVPWLRWFDFGGHVKEMKRTAKELDDILGEWLEEHHQQKKRKVGRDDLDFMDVMISLLDGTTMGGFDADTIIKATMLALIAGGSDTGAVTLTWAICLLLRNPLILEKAKQELDAQVGKDKCISLSDINKLVYLQAIVKETLRLYPPGPLSAPREFSENCILGGFEVKKGTRLITNLWKINTDPSVWPDPLEFKPERFLTTHKDVDVRGHHFELLPFGCGRRICPGISFGLQMVHLTLASFLHAFEILNPSTELVDMTESFGLSNTKATSLEVLVKPSLSPTCYQ